MKKDTSKSNDNLHGGIIHSSLSRETMEAELRATIERWLHRGVPAERLNTIVFNLSKDLAHYAIEHAPADRDRALERYNQVDEQMGVMMIIQASMRADYVEKLCASTNDAEDMA